MEKNKNMFTNNRWIRLIKDVLFAGIGLWIMSRSSFFAVLFGAFAFIWYGRDAYLQAKVLWQEKTFKPKQQEEVKKGGESGRISVSPDTKEVDFEKE